MVAVTAAARPNGPRLSCGAQVVNHKWDSTIPATRQLQALLRHRRQGQGQFESRRDG